MCGCSPDLADDLVQDALLAAWHKRIPEQPDAVAAAWLRAAVNNLWRMHLRSQTRRERHLDAILAELAVRQGSAADDGEAWLTALRSCLQGLDGRARRLLDLHYADGSSRTSIATALGMRPDGVKTLLRRVRDVLRQCVLRRLAPEPGNP